MNPSIQIQLLYLILFSGHYLVYNGRDTSEYQNPECSQIEETYGKMYQQC